MNMKTFWELEEYFKDEFKSNAYDKTYDFILKKNILICKQNNEEYLITDDENVKHEDIYWQLIREINGMIHCVPSLECETYYGDVYGKPIRKTGKTVNLYIKTQLYYDEFDEFTIVCGYNL